MLAFQRRLRRLHQCVPLLAAALCLPGLSTVAHAQSATTYTYDGRGRLTGVNDGTGVKSTYVFDQANNRSNVTTQLQFATSWEAESLPHIIGYADSNGWAANVTIDSNYLTYGPYTATIPVGSHVAVWRMMIDVSNAPDNSAVATIDINDATTMQQLASKTLYRHDWAAGYAYQVFELPFTLDSTRAGHAIEIRTYYIGAAYLRVDKLGYY
jgi:YD repeat-containing protein